MSRCYQKRRYKHYCLTVNTALADDAFIQVCCETDKRHNFNFQKISSSDFTEVYSFEYRGKRYIYKSFLRRNGWEGLKNFFRGVRSKRGLRGHLLLEKHGFSVAKVCIQGHQPDGRNFLVMEFIEQAIELEELFMHFQDSKLFNGVNKEQAIKLLGKMIGRLHAARIIHGDLRWGNILVQPCSHQGLQYVLIDNERTQQYCWLPDNQRLKNLVQLNLIPGINLINEADRQLFFDAYAHYNPVVLKNNWAKKITQKTHYRLVKKGLII